MGRNGFSAMQIRLSGIHHIEQDRTITTVLSAHSEVFKSKITGYIGPTVHLEMKETATPKFLKARKVPFPLRPVVECELLALQKESIIEPV